LHSKRCTEALQARAEEGCATYGLCEIEGIDWGSTQNILFQLGWGFWSNLGGQHRNGTNVGSLQGINSEFGV